MADQITTYYETEFSKNWEMLAQQKESRLGGAVTATTITGKRRKFNQLETGSMQEVTTRKGDTPDGDSTGYAYWIYRRKFERVGGSWCCAPRGESPRSARFSLWRAA